jgi:hypothetical protein
MPLDKKWLEEEYIGDGLYVSFDGYQMCLRAPTTKGDEKVYLEPSVWASLVEYKQRLDEAIKVLNTPT